MTAEAARRARPRLRLPVGPSVAVAVATLFLAGAVHISTILLVPALARSDGWSRLEGFAGEEQFSEIPSDDSGAGVPGLDPLFLNAACRLRLDEAPAAITTEAQDRFWSLALYDPQGTIVFSLNDRTAVDGRLDMLVVSPAQNAALRLVPAPTSDQTVVVESPSADLVALLRLFAPTERARTEARQALADSECFSEPLPEPAAASG